MHLHSGTAPLPTQALLSKKLLACLHDDASGTLRASPHLICAVDITVKVSASKSEPKK